MYDTKNLSYSFLYIGTGALFLALGTNLFLEPQALITGGATGIGIILQRILSIPIWITNLIINIPLLLVAYRQQGRLMVKKTVFGTLILSFFLGITDLLPIMAEDRVLSAIFGGVLSGVGIGLIFRGKGSTGGSDLLATLINKKMPDIRVSTLLLIIDGIIITLGLFIFGKSSVMYSVIALYISAKVVDMVTAGVNYAKVAFILSDISEKISDELMTRLQRGVTVLNGRGGYTGRDKNVLMVVVGSRQVGELKQIIGEMDKNAFVFIGDVREVMGYF